MKSGALFCLCTLLAAVLLPASVAADAAGLLMKMNKAFVEQDYDGVFTFYTGNDLTSVRVVHKVIAGEPRERLIHLNGAAREIHRRGEEVKCIVMPGDDLAVLEESIPSGPFARSYVREFERLGSTYTVDKMGEGRVAGRLAQRIAIHPRDSHRYGYRLWLDATNYMLLRSELVDEAGTRLEIFQFNDIRFGGEVRDEALLADEMKGSMVNHITLKTGNDAIAVAGQEPLINWRVGWLPPGFHMASADIRVKPVDGKIVNSMIYSDGLATFSIFLEPMPLKGAARMVTRSGALAAVSAGVMGAEDYYLATLVGEIPEGTGVKIVESISAK